MTDQALDDIDRGMLALLQRNNRRTLRDLADALEISAPTCLRRMRRLERLGVIRAHAALLDSQRVGLGVRAYVEISLVNASGSEMASFERRMQRCPDVIQCSELSGEVDYLLTVVTRDLEAYGEFTHRHLAVDRGVRSYRSLLVLRQTKNEHELPV